MFVYSFLYRVVIMAVCKRVMDMHGGTISVRSEGEGRGASFRVEIPIHRMLDEGELMSANEARRSRAADRGFGSRNPSRRLSSSNEPSDRRSVASSSRLTM